jgi:hypothetical protein
MTERLFNPKTTNYEHLVRLLYLHDQNLPPFKDARTNRIQSTQKMIKLINTAERTCPTLPMNLFALQSNDRTPAANPSRMGR